MPNGELQTVVNFRKPDSCDVRAVPFQLTLNATPFVIDFRALPGSDLAGTPFRPSGVYIDNTQGTENLVVLVNELNYRMICQSGELINLPYPAAKYSTVSITGQGAATVIFVDYPVEPYESSLTGGTPVDIEWGEIIGNIDLQLDLIARLNTKVDKVMGFGLSENSFTNAEKTKLAGIQAGAQVNTVTSVAGRTGAVVLTKADVNLNNVNDTSDLAKPISTATQAGLDLKQDALTPGAWTNLTLTNGWTTDDGTPQRARVRRIGPFGQLEIVIQRLAGPSNLSPFTLPVGFRPASFVGLSGTDFSAANFRALIVVSNGVVITNGLSLNEFQAFGVIFYIGT